MTKSRSRRLVFTLGAVAPFGTSSATSSPPGQRTKTSCSGGTWGQIVSGSWGANCQWTNQQIHPAWPASFIYKNALKNSPMIFHLATSASPKFQHAFFFNGTLRHKAHEFTSEGLYKCDSATWRDILVALLNCLWHSQVQQHNFTPHSHKFGHHVIHSGSHPNESCAVQGREALKLRYTIEIHLPSPKRV